MSFLLFRDDEQDEGRREKKRCIGSRNAQETALCEFDGNGAGGEGAARERARSRGAWERWDGG